MRAKKIMTTLVVMALLFSFMVVVNKLDIKIMDQASAVPGVDEWGYPTEVSTTDLKYSTSEQDVDINTTGLEQGESFYLYYPAYSGSFGTSYNLTWQQYNGPGNDYITVNTPGEDEQFDQVVLNRSGMWVLVNASNLSTPPRVNNPENLSNTIDKWFWVNTSDAFQMTVSPDEVYYAKNQTITINVSHLGAGTDAIVDIRKETTDAVITSGIKDTGGDGEVTLKNNYLNRLTSAGNYTIISYWDVDTPTQNEYDIHGYNYTHGNSSYNGGAIDPAGNGADYYNYTLCGPWDPPEYNSTYYSDQLKVLTGVPTWDIPEGNQTMFWSFSGYVNITVRNYDDTNITNLTVYVYNSDDENVTGNLTIDTSNVSNGWIRISNNTWGVDQKQNVFGENGTWIAYIFNDTDGVDDAHDREWEQEWNTTAEWEVTSAPGLQFKWIDDDGAAFTGGDNDGEVPAVPSLTQQPLDIKFQLIGDDHTYYGAIGPAADAPANYGENITVSGDALFLSSKTLDNLDGVTYSSGTWTVPLTPTMALNGGEITFSASWSGYGSVQETLYVGGDDLNGSIVSISPTEFTVDENITLTVTVQDSVGDPMKNAKVWLYWVGDENRTLVNSDDWIISYRNGGGSSAGEYEFFVNRSMQTDNQTDAYGGSPMAPRNISAYVQLFVGGDVTNVYGYALVRMKPKTDLKVTMEPSTVMAGQKIRTFWFNTTVVDAQGNTTSYPADSDLKVRIFNSTGEDVTTDIGSLSTSDTDGNDNKTADNEFLQVPGTYTVHAWNNTHNSEGNNATLVVNAVDVDSSLSEFIWNVDDNESSTFTVTYNGEIVNGTLRIDNITDVGDFNRTWALCNFTPNIGQTTGSDDAGENVSIQKTITNGVATIHNITADRLPGSVAIQNITFYFKPKTPSGSGWAVANGRVPVKIADVTASPGSLPVNVLAEVEIMATGRGTGLGNVLVNLSIPGLAGEMSTTTDSNGMALFAFTPLTTGDIAIEIENRTSDVVIPVTNYKVYIDVDPEADEGDSFTVTALNGTSAGTAIEGAAVTFNRQTEITDANGQATFTAPAVTSDREYTITATKVGHAEDTETIVVVNRPKLVIVPPTEASAGSTFQVTIADDRGNAIIGATVTIGDQTAISGAQGLTTLTAPTEEGTYTLVASKTGFQSSDPIEITITPGGIPGFEVLTLIAAIGVAFILLRRRRH